MRPVRTETPEDHVAMHAVHTAACGRPGAADLVQALRGVQARPLSLIAVEDGCLVGPIALSPVTLMAKTATIEARGLAPMAVLPDAQRQGIGARLVEAGLAACRVTPSSVVVVLGHPHSSPRCGCTTAPREGRAWEHEAPAAALMGYVLTAEAGGQGQGVGTYRPAFAGFSTAWQPDRVPCPPQTDTGRNAPAQP